MKTLLVFAQGHPWTMIGALAIVVIVCIWIGRMPNLKWWLKLLLCAVASIAFVGAFWGIVYCVSSVLCNSMRMSWVC